MDKQYVLCSILFCNIRRIATNSSKLIIFFGSFLPQPCSWRVQPQKPLLIPVKNSNLLLTYLCSFSKKKNFSDVEFSFFSSSRTELFVIFFFISQTTAQLYVAINWLPGPCWHCARIFLSRLLCLCWPDCESFRHGGKSNWAWVQAEGGDLLWVFSHAYKMLLNVFYKERDLFFFCSFTNKKAFWVLNFLLLFVLLDGSKLAFPACTHQHQTNVPVIPPSISVSEEVRLTRKTTEVTGRTKKLNMRREKVQNTQWQDSSVWSSK